MGSVSAELGSRCPWVEDCDVCNSDILRVAGYQSKVVLHGYILPGTGLENARVRPFCHLSPADLAEIINSLLAAGL